MIPNIKINSRIGFYLLMIGSIIPILNSIRILMYQVLIQPNDYWLYFFSHIGPWNLMLAGIIGLVNIFIFLGNNNYLAWWLHFLGILWIGGGDSFGALIFYLKADLPFFPICLPIVVTTINLLGLFLVRSKMRFERIEN